MVDNAAGQEIIVEAPHSAGRAILAAASRKKGGIWVATVQENSRRMSIEVFDGDRFDEFLSEKENLPLGARHFQLLETHNGDLWMLGTKAAGRYTDGEYQRFEIPEGIQTGPFSCLREMGNGEIWLGALGGNLAGIVKFDGEKWKNAAIEMSTIIDILEGRNGSVWAASTSGVYRNVEGTWISNRQEDGLYPFVYALLEDSQGQLWVGTSHGIYLYYPEADPDPPQTVIRSEDNLSITPPGGEAHIIYSGIDRWNYTEPDRLLYSHRMDGGSWSSFSNETIATFSGLSTGGHVFDVRAVDRNWNVELEPASFTFKVLPQWYENPIFFLLLTTSSGAVLFILGLHLYHHFNLEWIVSKRTSSLRQAYDQLRALTSELSRTEEQERRRVGD